jgi:hypothetical protein
MNPSRIGQCLLMKSRETKDYTICQFRSYLSSSCRSTYNVTVGRRSLDADCPTGRLELAQLGAKIMAHESDAMDGYISWDFQTILYGVDEQRDNQFPRLRTPRNGNSSIAKLISQFRPFDSSDETRLLSNKSPSTAEIISSLVAVALLRRSFYGKISTNELIDDTYQSFNANLQVLQYGSGPVLPWHRFFYPVLAIAFVANGLCLGYFIFRMGLVVDFTDSQDAFGVAFTSAPSFAHRQFNKDAIHPLQRDEKLVLRQGPDERYRFELATERKSGDEIELLERLTE